MTPDHRPRPRGGDVEIIGARLAATTGAPTEAGRPDGLRDGLWNISVTAGRITSVTPASTPRRQAGHGATDGTRRIEADGRIVLPGLIDAHVHGAAAVYDPDVQLAMLRQGVTSIVVGQDGVGVAPASAAAATWASGYFAAIDGEHPHFAGGTMAQFLAGYDGATALNIASLVPHGTVRYAVVGDAARPATARERTRLAAIVDRALAEGAAGVSTGLEYVPAAYADSAELHAVASITARRGGVHVSHMRGYEAKAAGAMAELTEIAVASGVATHVSHYHGPAGELIALLDDATSRGVDVTFDSYPYLRGCSILSMVALPTWLPIADPDRATASVLDPGVRERLLTSHLPALADVWPRVTMAAVPGELNWAEGRSLLDVAARLGLSPEEAVLELLVSTRLRAGCVFEQPPTNSAASVAALMRDRRHIGGSDAIYQGGSPHPRGWGAFARSLSRGLRSGDWTWADAQWHLSTAAALRFGLGARGAIAPGAVADLVLVDQDTLADTATYETPRAVATGIGDVVVAGIAVLADGDLVAHEPGRFPGRGLRSTRGGAAVASRLAPATDQRTKGLRLAAPLSPAELLAQTAPAGLDAAIVATPALSVDSSAVDHNIAVMAAFCQEHGFEHAPHSKTTMVRDLLERQLAAGAWGATVATPGQLRTVFDWGVARAFLANELPASADAQWLASAMAEAPDREVIVQVDSLAAVAVLAAAFAAAPPEVRQRLAVLVELGVPGGRTGVRSIEDGLAVGKAVVDAALVLRGVTGYEGSAGPDTSQASLRAVAEFLTTLRHLARALCDADLVAADRPVIISAGGSAFLDVVAGQLSGRLRDAGRLSADASRPRDVTVIVRSGAYVVHDSGFYGRMDPWARMAESPGLIAATTVWGTVLAVPEPGLVLVDVGRRDVSYDIDLPRVRYLRRAGSTRAQAWSDAADPAEVVSLNDQHLYLRIAGAVAVGDVIGFGTSHPCTLFDKWRVALLTAGPPDADDSVIGIVGIDL